MPTKYALFVKEHYDKVRHLPNKDRMKALSLLYKKMGGKPMQGGELEDMKKEKAGNLLNNVKLIGDLFGGKVDAKKKASKKVKGAGLLSDAFSYLPINPFDLIGGALPEQKKKGRKLMEKMPLNPTPPSVPVNRVADDVPAGNYPSGVVAQMARYNPNIKQFEDLKTEIPFVRQSTANPQVSDLKQMLKLYGMDMPKHMRNVPMGGKLSKKHLEKIYKHTLKTHGVRGGNIFDDMWDGFSTGFKMPFQAIGSVADAVL